MSGKRIILAGIVAAAIVGNASADIIHDFNSATGAPGWSYTLNGGGWDFGGSGNFDDGVAGEDGHVGGSGKIATFALSAALDQGVSGAPGDHAVAMAATNVASGGGFWFAALKLNAEQLSSTDLSQMVLSGQFKAPNDVRYRLSLAYDNGGRLQFDAIGNGQWQDIGGLLSTANVEGTFDPAATGLRVEVNTLDEWSWGAGATLLVDNVRLSPIPEPAGLGVLMAGILAAVARRRRGD